MYDTDCLRLCLSTFTFGIKSFCDRQPRNPVGDVVFVMSHTLQEVCPCDGAIVCHLHIARAQLDRLFDGDDVNGDLHRVDS